ncbi:hypothetical protein K7X08_014821 [Anisodus acutangulus]|uniref:Endoglucanase n=1 Tax=Anisodus acutangulus TaxID=402998 RepID=A0A9Q1LLU7_9SOLA|nr:hypothetical protein K7X08_014821 [Anisodus acutangulus]
MGEKSRKGGWCGWILALIVVAAAAGAIVALVRKKHNDSTPDAPGNPGSPEKKYADALKTACSSLMYKNCLSETASLPHKDLSKGMYDAGDHMKFNFPMAYTATVLSWTILEYGDQMKVVNQLEPAQDSLKWITDYLINSHPKDNVLYIQVGDPDADHKCWDRPEDTTEARPLIQINTRVSGTEVAAETAAAMAAASLVFKSSDSTYSSDLLKHAKQLFTFADKYRGSYSENIPEVATYYNSTGCGDELLWAATWLYHATGDQTYYDYATGKNADSFGNFGNPTWFSWDNKLAGTQVLLSRVSFFNSKASNSDTLQEYRKTAEAVMCGLLPKSPTATSSRTDSGLIWISEWNALKHPVASAFLAVLYSDYMLTSRSAKITCNGDSYAASDLRKFAISQTDYVLGDNPSKMSYLVGYGDNYPQYVHHRGASIPKDADVSCKDGWKYLDSKEPNPNVATGALVGGPFLNETYIDSRNNSMQAEPTTYNSSVLVGLLSGLVTTSSVVQSFT